MTGDRVLPAPPTSRFVGVFTEFPVRSGQARVDVQQLMKERGPLTDYSSVGFDFSFLHAAGL